MNYATARNRYVPALALAAIVALAVVALTLLGGGERANAAESPATPNIVFIQTDDQTLCSVLQDPLCPADAHQVMPKTVQLLGDEGTIFRNYYATHPRCCPSRASYLTGLYSHNHKIENNTLGYSRYDYHGRDLPAWLHAAGYRTAHIGKYMNGYKKRYATENPIPGGTASWDEWYATVDQGIYNMFDTRMMLKTPLPVPIRDAQTGQVLTVTPPAPMEHQFGDSEGEYQTDLITSIATDFIVREQNASSPFFLAINVLAPHKEHQGKQTPNPRAATRHIGDFDGVPLPEGPAFDEKDVSDKPGFIRNKPRIGKAETREIERRYRDRLASLLAVDDLVGLVYGTLEQTGQLEDTVIIFTSDNGFMQGEHRLDAGKVALYDEDVRVPLIVRGPGFPAGQERLQPVGNIDLGPTMADIAGATAIENEMLPPDGISILPFADDPALDTNRTVLLENGDDGSAGIRTKTYTYLRHEHGEELYDNVEDPHQLEGIHDKKSARDLVKKMRADLRIYKKCEGVAECNAPGA